MKSFQLNHLRTFTLQTNILELVLKRKIKMREFINKFSVFRFGRNVSVFRFGSAPKFRCFGRNTKTLFRPHTNHTLRSVVCTFKIAPSIEINVTLTPNFKVCKFHMVTLRSAKSINDLDKVNFCLICRPKTKFN